MNIFRIIKEAAVKFWKNPVLALPLIFDLIIAYIPVAIFFVILSLITGVSVFVIAADPSSIADSIAGSFALVVTLAVLTLLAWLAIGSFFDGILIDMIQSRKIKFNLNGRKFFGRIFIFNACFAILLLILLAILVVLVVELSKINAWLVLIPIIFFIITVLLIPIITLTIYYIVIDDTGIWNAVKKSCKKVRENYLNFMGLLIALIFISIIAFVILSFIPTAGVLIYSVLASTYSRICFYIFITGK